MSRIVRYVGAMTLACVCATTLSIVQTDAATRKGEIHHMLADIYDRQNRVHDAMTEYDQLLKITPGDAEAHYNFGKFLLRQKENKFAAGQLKTATSLDGSHPEYWAQLGNALLLTKDYNGAIDAFSKGGPACAVPLQNARQYVQQMKQVEQYNKQIKQQQQQQDQ
jgi:Tfp pilus assembly protein PilF